MIAFFWMLWKEISNVKKQGGNQPLWSKESLLEALGKLNRAIHDWLQFVIKVYRRFLGRYDPRKSLYEQFGSETGKVASTIVSRIIKLLDSL